MTIDIKNITCFGFNSPRDKSWLEIFKKVQEVGWNKLSIPYIWEVENQLASSILNAYDSLVTISFVDLDTDFKYVCKFDNIAKKWKLELPGTVNSKDVISPEDLKNFFSDKLFKKVCRRSDKYLTEANSAIEAIILPKINEGFMLKINEIKLEAVHDMLKDPVLRRNLKTGKS